jgi:hypothetical protein
MDIRFLFGSKYAIDVEVVLDMWRGVVSHSSNDYEPLISLFRRSSSFSTESMQRDYRLDFLLEVS